PPPGARRVDPGSHVADRGNDGRSGADRADRGAGREDPVRAEAGPDSVAVRSRCVPQGDRDAGPGHSRRAGRSDAVTRGRDWVAAGVRAGIESDRQHGAVIPPVHLAANFSFEGLSRKRRYDYTRSGNPTRDLLSEALAELEEGAGAVITASGMAAIHLV